MQTAILILDGSDVKAKRVYGGDISDSVMTTEIARLQTLYPVYTIQLFSTDQDSTFVNAIVNSPLSDI